MDDAGSPAPEVDPEGCSPCTATAAGRWPPSAATGVGCAAGTEGAPAGEEAGSCAVVGPDAMVGTWSEDRGAEGMPAPGSGVEAVPEEVSAGSGRPAPPWQLPVPAGRPGQVRESGQDRGVGLDAGLGELRVSGGGPDGQRVRNWWVRCRWSRSRWARKRRTRIQWIPNRWMRSAQGRSTPTPPKPRLPTLTRRNPRSPRSWRCRWWCEG
jgi:hypothetical protein